MKSDISRTCESCKYLRARTPKDRKHEAGFDLAQHWCAKNDQPTVPTALRCGGDDYWPKGRAHGDQKEAAQEVPGGH